MNGDTGAQSIASDAAPRLSSVVNKKFLSHILLYIWAVLLTVLAAVLYKLEITSLFGGFLFAFALFGLRWPAHFLAVFVFFVAFKHREFTHMAMQFGPLPVYISEWALLILLVAGLPKVVSTARKYLLPFVLILAYIFIGLLMLYLSLPNWGGVALRHFAIVYYSLFAMMVFAHIKTLKEFKRLIAALIIGTVPNLIGEIGNFLYDTLPVTSEQKNYSMRDSFFYLVALGFCLPFLKIGVKKINYHVVFYGLAVSSIVLLYSYSKTGMIALVVLAGLYFVSRMKSLPKAVIVIVCLLFILPYFFTPSGKIHPFKDIFTPSTYEKEKRYLIDISALRDFTEYPYGIGFGPPIFGDHGRVMIKNHESFHSLHNSYLTVARRTGVQGFVIFIAIIALAISRGISTYRAFGEEEFPGKIAMGLLLAMVSAFLFPFSHVVLEGPFMGIPFWLIAGCLIILPRIFPQPVSQPV